MTDLPVLGTALITGASSGIGELYADRLAQRGYDLVLVARNVARLDALATRLGAQTGRRVETLAVDLGDAGQRAGLAERVRTDPALTLVVNNAGLMNGGTELSAAEAADVTAMLNVNVLALTELSAAAAANFRTRGTGAIVNLSSVMAFIDSPRFAAYAASKAYVLNYTLALDLELRDKGVQVQAVLPGVTRTPMTANLGASEDMVMDVADLVDAALAGFDRRELVTIPSLPDAAQFAGWLDTRTALRPHLSRRLPAARYGVAPALAPAS